MYVHEYLDLTFHNVVGSIALDPKITPLFLCCAHVFKMVTNDIKKQVNNYTVQQFLKELIGAAINFTSFRQLVNWFENTVLLLCSSYKTHHMLNAYRNLLQLCCNLQMHEMIDMEYTEMPQEYTTETVHNNL